QAEPGIAPVPGYDVGQGAQAVDTGVVPEVDEHGTPPESLWSEGALDVQPLTRPEVRGAYDARLQMLGIHGPILSHQAGGERGVGDTTLLVATCLCPLIPTRASLGSPFSHLGEKGTAGFAAFASPSPRRQDAKRPGRRAGEGWAAAAVGRCRSG